MVARWRAQRPDRGHRPADSPRSGRLSRFQPAWYLRRRGRHPAVRLQPAWYFGHDRPCRRAPGVGHTSGAGIRRLTSTARVGHTSGAGIRRLTSTARVGHTSGAGMRRLTSTARVGPTSGAGMRRLTSTAGGPGLPCRQPAASSGTAASCRRSTPPSRPNRHASRIATAVTATMIVEIALISGVTPNLILP